MSLNNYFEYLEKNSPVLSREEETEVARKMKNGDSSARNKLIESNMRFVTKIAKEYQNRGLSLEDLVQEGNVGLCIAADKYDPDSGNKFISYAVFWIRQAILKALEEKTRAVRLPSNRVAQLNVINKCMHELRDEEEPVTEESLSQRTGFDIKTVHTLLPYLYDECSLDSFVSDEENTTLEDMIECSQVRIEDNVIDSVIQENVRSCVESLDEREQGVIRKRFGFDGEKPMSLSEVGTQYSLTKERIRQIEKKCLRTLSPALSCYVA